MSIDALSTSTENGVLTVVFNRPERLNAMTADMETELVRVAARVNDDPTVHAVVFTGATGKRPAFVAGQDVGELSAIADAQAAEEVERHSEELLEAIERIGVPTIAAVGGPCVGVGALIVGCCDIVIVSESVKFGFPIARTVGNLLSTKNTRRMIDLVGVPRVKNMVLRARLMSGRELFASGAASELVGDAELGSRAREIAEEIGALAPLTLSGTKTSIRRMRDAPGHADNLDLLTEAYLSDDFAEAVNAFLEKRSPRWAGR
ncbi:enoyl-CoA hydratase [Leucobacter allii]|uniref:Enoyl-CoA hydratase n=1 Tax=Leucobacter allii TaxID=2932247 RepID=A0ABY4FJ67_9MICO|nr:enoyl-CoA hydratase [Leucobacter allii]UOQ56725.1 enoyl-CoA hydratase [Leucobacter allii]UOR01159.1 enoyl-CoA hydratase [Leucobacter allii]